MTRNQEPRITGYQPALDNYIEKTGPDELLNPNLKLQYTLNARPTFTGILHSKEDCSIKEIHATINDKENGKPVLEGDKITFTPDFDLDYGHNVVYIAVVFENNHFACAYWRFDILKEPPSIMGFLGDEKGRKYFICFSREMEKEKIEDVKNWKLNGDSSLIEKVEFLDSIGWAMVQLVSDDVKADFRDDDYWLCFDTGDGVTETHLIPKHVERKDGENPKDQGCGDVIHDPEHDEHFSNEIEWHYVTFFVELYDPECELTAQWQYKIEQKDAFPAISTAIEYETTPDWIEFTNEWTQTFTLSEGFYTLGYSLNVCSDVEVKVTDNCIPANQVWDAKWIFPEDNTPPEFTLSPEFKTGEEVADFLPQHYWEKKGGTPGELPLNIQYMIGLLRTDNMKCKKFVIWGAEDRRPFGAYGHGSLSYFGNLDWGWDKDSPPYGVWFENDMDPLGGFVVDLHPPYGEELLEWSDPRFNPLSVDHSWEGEYKLWIFDYEDFINANIDLIAEHHDTFQMKPRVQDMWGNWRRAPNIFKDMYKPQNITLDFVSPSGGNRKQYINLLQDEELPEYIPDECRGRQIDVKVEILTPKDIVIPQGSYVLFSWVDPEIDTSFQTTTNETGENIQQRAKFPWLSDSKLRCDCVNDECRIIPYPTHNPNVEYFPNPESMPDPALYPGYPHKDNSFPNPTAQYGFSTLGQAYGHNLTYLRPGYGFYKEYKYYALVENYNSDDCKTIIETEFYTSNFGGDNYILTAQLWFPSPLWGHIIPVSNIEETWQINVWRKAYIFISCMAVAQRDPDDIMFYISSDGSYHFYDFYDGPFRYNTISYLNNAFDDCFIELKQIDPVQLDTEWWDIIEEASLAYYAHNKTDYNSLDIPHRRQSAIVDHINSYAWHWMNVLRGKTPIGDENHHTFVAMGTIMDIYGNRLDNMTIDFKPTQNPDKIIPNSAAHELGHSFYFKGYSETAYEGHRSGPGIMWSPPSSICPNEDYINEGKRCSYFWGDHVFVLRLFNDNI